MKILFSAITYHPTVGGADDYVRSLAEGAARAGHEAVVVASDLERHVEGVKLKETKERVLNGVRIIRCRSFRVRGHVYPVWPSFPIVVAREKPDLVHAFSLGYYSVDGVALLGRRLPVVVSPTGGRVRSGLLYRSAWRAARRAVEGVASWTALSEDERRLLEKAHPDAPEIRLLPPSLDPAEWTKARPDPFPHLEGKRVLYAGRLAKGKGIEDLVEAFHEMRRTSGAQGEEARAQLILVGPSYGLELPDEPFFTKTGSLDRETLCAAIQHCDVLVLPSYHEGFGIVLIEAMAAGKPVIAYDNSAMPELCRDHENGILVPTGDRAGLARALVEILTNDKKAHEMGEQGHARAIREFSRARMMERVETIWREALSGR